jgi:hypothetical protein
MKSWFLIYTLWLGFNSPGQEIMVAVWMPDEATCMLEAETAYVYAAEVLEGPPNPRDPHGLYREMSVLSKACRWGEF